MGILGQLAAQLVLDDKGYTAGMNKASKASTSLTKSGTDLSAVMGKVTKTIGLTAAAVTGVGFALTAVGKRAGQIEGLGLGFERSFGDATESLEKLREASVGTISDFDLMQSANKAALLGVTDSVEDLSGLMLTARLRGREMGMTTTQAFDDIVTGIGRGSPLILDNLGIKIPDALKKTMEGMNDAEKAQALLSFAIEDGAKIASEYGDVNLTTGEKTEILIAKLTNLKDKLIDDLAEPLGDVIDKFADWTDKLTENAGVIKDETSDEIAGLTGVLTNEDFGLLSAIERVGVAWGELMKAITGEELSPMETLVTMLAGWAFLLGKVADGISAVIFWVGDLIKDLRDLGRELGGLNLGELMRVYAGVSTLGLSEVAIKALQGFANGGEFTVGGNGGTDSQLVAFKATPGEKVSVQTPQQQASGGGITIQNLQVGSSQDLPVLMSNLNWLYRRTV